MKRFSIIVCTYNRDAYIFSSLSAIASNDFPCELYEIVLVNNNSTDKTEDECNRFKTDHTEVDFRYFLETKQGLSYARNRGIVESTGEYLIFLDDDSFISNNYLKLLDEYIKQYPDMSAFGGPISPIYESGEEPKWMSKWTYSWVSAINLGKKVCMFSGNKYPIGANMGFKKNVFSQYGDFNVNLGRSKKDLMAGEEKDIFSRLKAANEKIYYFPKLIVEHVIPAKRTTLEYIKKMGVGVGISERIRCESIGYKQMILRVIMEIVKWIASIILCVYYIISFRITKGTYLLIFRYNVTKGLLNIGI